MSRLAMLVGARFATIPYWLKFEILSVRRRTVLVWDEQEQRRRIIPRAIITEALRQRKLQYLGLGSRRRSA